MMRSWLLLFFCFFSHAVFSQSTAETVLLDTIENVLDKPIDVFDKKLYLGIPKDHAHVIPAQEDYKLFLNRYRAEEFSYSENIQDKISFLDRLGRYFEKWFRILIPKTSFKFKDEYIVVIIFIAVVLLVYIFYKLIYSGNSFFRKEHSEKEYSANIAYVERNLLHTDLRNYIDEALLRQDYSLVIRYLQLLNIQKLAQAKHIEWRYSKTNFDFCNEIMDEGLRDAFSACTRVYDYVWFGGFILTEVDFKRFEQEFKSFQAKIS